MRCKKGDLAFYVGPFQSLSGFVFRCVEPAMFCGTAAWVTDPPPPSGKGYLAIGLVMDASLSPIRPGDISYDEVRDLYASREKETA